MTPPHHSEPLRQQLIRSLTANGVKPRVVVSNDTAADQVIRMGAIAKRLNQESALDPIEDAQ